ncbi:MAG: hypothetical protein IH881_13905 [Myxococcales bacterium]|nr:hypothetical protein [Myxococcales bacterium]
MIYHSRSVTGCMLWFRYALLAGKPWRSFSEIYDQHLESPGTKAYTVEEARELCRNFSSVDIKVQLNHGELLMGEVGQRHKGLLLTIAKAILATAPDQALLRQPRALPDDHCTQVIAPDLDKLSG